MKTKDPSIEPCGTPKKTLVTETEAYLCVLFLTSETS